MVTTPAPMANPPTPPNPTMAAVLDYYGVARRTANGWVSALCCFHDESRMSLRIQSDESWFICLSCGVRGSGVIEFIMAKEKCDRAAAIAIAETIPGDRQESHTPPPSTIDGRPAPVATRNRGTYRPRWRRR